MNGGRREAIVRALGAELERQSRQGGREAPRLSGAFDDHVVFVEGQIDLAAMAEAVASAIADAPPAAPVEEGRTPAELNAGNDD